MIPYNSISIKSNPPHLYSIARALDSGAREFMPMASMKVTSNAISPWKKGGDSHIKGKMRCMCGIMYAQLKCRGGQPLHHNFNALKYMRFVMTCTLSLNYKGMTMIEPVSCISCFNYQSDKTTCQT